MSPFQSVYSLVDSVPKQLSLAIALVVLFMVTVLGSDVVVVTTPPTVDVVVEVHVHSKSFVQDVKKSPASAPVIKKYFFILNLILLGKYRG